MILEVKKFPESKEVMNSKDWFLIGDYDKDMIIGDSAYARVLDESEYILVEKTTADEFNPALAQDSQEAFDSNFEDSFNNNSEIIHNYLSIRDPGDEHVDAYLNRDQSDEVVE